MNLCRRGIEAASDDEGWANLGAVGSHIAKQSPDFDPRTWGYSKLVDLVTADRPVRGRAHLRRGPRQPDPDPGEAQALTGRPRSPETSG